MEPKNTIVLKIKSNTPVIIGENQVPKVVPIIL